jgi:hypothetical protein
MSLRKAVHAGIVWLTAVTTLIAAFPQLACACPGREAKAISPLSTMFSPGGCPCGNGCCKACAGDPRRNCCTGGDHGKGSPNTSSEGGLQSFCKKISTAGLAFVSTASGKILDPDDTTICCLIALPPQAAVTPHGPHTSFAWALPPHAPPPDLVTLFRHLLI